MIRTLILVSLMAAVGGTILAFKLLGFWAVLVVPVVAIAAVVAFVKLFGEKLLTRVLSAPFKAKGAALRDAAVEVHALREASDIAGATHDDGDDGNDGEAQEEIATDGPAAPLRYFWIDATITPAAASPGPFQHWEPGELQLVLPGRDPMEGPDEDGPCRILKVRVAQDGTMADDEGWEAPGCPAPRARNRGEARGARAAVPVLLRDVRTRGAAGLSRRGAAGLRSPSAPRAGRRPAPRARSTGRPWRAASSP